MRPFKIVDVFSSAPFKGNPVAVIIDGDGLSTGEMQAIAGWTNLSETVFVLPATQPQADYRLRIFTPRSELPFAGHPTLGAAHALLERKAIEARSGQITQECAAGLVPIRYQPDSGRLEFSLLEPKITFLSGADIAALEAAYGAALCPEPRPALIDVGPKWVIAKLATPHALLSITPDLGAAAALDVALGATGVTLFAPGDTRQDQQGGDIAVRSFAAADGIIEDPVCGSGNGAVAAFRRAAGECGDGDHYTAHQGVCMGREGRVHIAFDKDKIQVGGACITTAAGEINC